MALPVGQNSNLLTRRFPSGTPTGSSVPWAGSALLSSGARAFAIRISNGNAKAIRGLTVAASVEAYLTIIRKAYEGRLKLPAFQRDWKWKPSQVMLLLDSLRQGFPIGSFLFLQANPTVDLAPRDFKGSEEGAAAVPPEELVLDGQQRITAGLELFFGRGANHYFIDLKRIFSLIREQKVDLEDRDAIKAFLNDLDADDGYCKRLKASLNPKGKLLSNKLLWTGLLFNDDELEQALSDYCKAYPDEERFARFVIGRNFRPSSDANIPITTIAGATPIEAISRIFSTLNSTGKMLTPFELVVSVLFPQKVSLNDDVSAYRELYPFYAKIDATGDMLLQTVALFDGQDTKKASLPKTITLGNYRQYADSSVELLNDTAIFINQRIGLGLDASPDLLVYPVIFTPLAYVWKAIGDMELDHGARSAAEQKLVRWFVGAVLGRRYQQSTHDKQARDKQDIVRWIVEGDKAMPEWLTETYINNIRSADPDGAIGKLFRALLNSRGLKDPLTCKPVGVGSEKIPSAKHHIWPSRWVQHLTGWQKSTDSANLALNIMYVSEGTNGRWLNSDPREQLTDAINTLSSIDMAKEIYRAHGINDACFAILQKPEKTKQDFYDFISERESFFAGLLEQYGFKRPTGPIDTDDLDDDDR